MVQSFVRKSVVIWRLSRKSNGFGLVDFVLGTNVHGTKIHYENLEPVPI